LSSSKSYLRCTESYSICSISLVNLPAKNGRVISGRISKRDELFMYQKLLTNLSGNRVMCSYINGVL
jgi:hypothetical protein